MFKLKTVVQDKVSKKKGVLTHMVMESPNGPEQYVFRQYGINPETGHPWEKQMVIAERVIGGVVIDRPDDFPSHIILTAVEDVTTGFTGTVISLWLHDSGCVHAQVQGTHKKTGRTIQEDINVRDLKGPALKKMSVKAKAADQKAKPSPGNSDIMPRFGSF